MELSSYDAESFEATRLLPSGYTFGPTPWRQGWGGRRDITNRPSLTGLLDVLRPAPYRYLKREHR